MTEVEKQVMRLKSDGDLRRGVIYLQRRLATLEEIKQEIDRRKGQREYSRKQEERGES